MKPKLETIVGAVFVISIAAFLLLTWNIRQNKKNYEKSFSWVQHTNDVLILTEQIFSSSKDLERGMRGYVLTGEPDFLSPYEQNKTSIFDQLNHLRRLTSDNPHQQIRIDSLTNYIKRQIAVYQSALTLYKEKGTAAVQERMHTRTGFNTMQKLQNEVSAIKAEEIRLLTIRQSIHGKSSARLSRFFYIMITLLAPLLFIFLLIIYNNIKRRRKSEKMLSQNQYLLQSIIDNTSSLIYVKDRQGRFILVNKKLEQAFRMKASQLLGKTVFDISRSEYAELYQRNDEVVFNEGKLIEVQEDAVIDGKLHHFYAIKFPLYDGGKTPYALCGISTDLTNLITRQQLERQREIAEITIQAQEKERTEIALELHDNVNQLLASAQLLIEAAEMDLGLTTENDSLQLSKGRIKMAIDEIRRLSHAMMPPPLEENAFCDALLNIKDTINKSGKLIMELQTPPSQELSTLNNNLKLALYRIIQEQVSNIIKYSQARIANISLKLKNKHVEMVIADDGVGADLNKKRPGIGLQNIASRVELFNGHLEIATAPNKGFRLTTTFDIEPEAA